MKSFLATATVLLVLGGAFSALPAAASELPQETLPAGVFRMADGVYFHPKSGTRAPDLDALLAALPSEAAAPAMPAEPATFPLKAAMERARAELQRRIDAERPATPRYEPEEAAMRDVTLAIWNPITDHIRYVEARKQGTTLIPKTPDARVTVARTNGINSTYRVTGEDGEVVVAVRYQIYKDVSGSGTKYEVQEVTYVPYSNGIRTPEMAAYGSQWLDRTVQDVYGKLRQDGIGSQAFDGKLMADTVDPELVKAILAIEHLDVQTAITYPQESLDAFYALVGANEERSYNYSRSSAGAFGLAQFIPSTYASMARRPELGLNPDFEAGLKDPHNAIRTQVAYLDYIHSRLPETTVADWDADRDRIQEYLAASYNGGYPIVRKAMVVWDENMDAQERYIVRLRSRLKLETMHYVHKLRAVRDAMRSRATAVTAATR